MGAWYSKRCALTWKLKVTPYSRLLFQLAPSALRTEGIEFGLLHTPSAQEPGITVDRLVTKEGFPAEIGKRAYDKHTGRLAQVGLTQQVHMMGLLRTPTAQDYRFHQMKPANPEQTTLSQQAYYHNIHGRTGLLSPRFVAEMMGFPVNWTELPFLSCATNQSRDMETQSCHK
jgi:hypothetical protein